MKSTERIDASNQEMVTISHAEYEAMQAKLTMQNQQLDEQNKQLDEQSKQLEAKSAELAQALLQNQWLTEQLLVKRESCLAPPRKSLTRWSWSSLLTCLTRQNVGMRPLKNLLSRLKRSPASAVIQAVFRTLFPRELL